MDIGKSETVFWYSSFWPGAKLGTRVLRSSKQGERKTALKKAFRTPGNNSGKPNLAVMQEANEPYGLNGSPEPQRKVARQVGPIDAGIEVEPDTPTGECNLSRQLADRPCLTNRASLLTPHLGHHYESAAFEQAEATTSAAHLLMLASGAEQPVNISATQLDIPGRSHSPSVALATGNVCAANIPIREEVGRELSAPTDSLTSSSAYPTPGNFLLRLPVSSSILFARSACVLAEIRVGSPLKSVSVLTYHLCEPSCPAPNNVAHVYLAASAGPFQAIY